MNLYPIILFCYNRPIHTLKVLKALQKNELADQSTLYIYVDGPKANSSLENIENINKVREVIQQEKWCKKVIFNISKENIGCRNSIINGVDFVLKNHEAAIILEDDIITSKYFLKFMNESLEQYKHFPAVFSISGHNIPENKFTLPLDYQYDVYISPRLLNWGWATWKDRWDKVDWDKSFIPNFLNDKNQVEAFNRGGEDLCRMLIEEYDGKSDAWDIQFAYYHFKHHAVSIVPRHSYTLNIGQDGTGTHSTDQGNLKNDLNLSLPNPRFLDVIYKDKRIINAFYSSFYPKKRPIWKKIINRISRILGGKNVFVIKKKIYC